VTRPPGVALRRATAADLASVAAIEQASFGDPWSAGSFRSLVANPAVVFVVAATGATGATVVGYAVAWFAADEAELANLAVAASARGRGVGALLLDAVLAEAAHRGAATVYLEVRESNAAARRLYASRSFAEVGRRRRYYHNPAEDALVLARPIAPGPAAALPPDPGRSATAHRG
jgi:ribosomal-protein-alanine N-acetyltransferase